MHDFTPQKAKICKHARKKYQYLESQSLRSIISLYKNMNLHGNPGSNNETLYIFYRMTLDYLADFRPPCELSRW